MKLNTQDLKQKLEVEQEKYPFLNLEESTQLLVLSGSSVYGANTASSDVDYKGVVMNSLEGLTGLEKFSQVNTAGKKSTKTSSSEVDLVLLSLEKFTNDFHRCHFNAFQMVMSNEQFYTKLTPLGKRMVQEFPKFNCKYALNTFKGLSFSSVRDAKRDLELTGELKGKHMYHALNYSALGVEYAKEGQFLTYNKERAEFLQAVRSGEVFTSYEEFEKMYLENVATMELAFSNSKLPEKMNKQGLSELSTSLYREYLF